MEQIAGFPYFAMEFDKTGQPVRPQQLTDLRQFVTEAAGNVTDLLVLSHGWNNNMREAKALYDALLGNVRQHLDGAAFGALRSRNFAAVGVLWPSKRFEDDELISGGEASVGGDPRAKEMAAIADRVRDLKQLLGAEAAGPLDRALALLPEVEASEQKRGEFADAIRDALKRSAPARPDAREQEDASDTFFALDGRRMMDLLSASLDDEDDDDDAPLNIGGGAAVGRGPAGGNAGGEAGLRDLFRKSRDAVRNLLNFTTYWEMKARAGTIGRGAVNGVLADLIDARRRAGLTPLKIHLVGHSFGGRLVTAVASGRAGPFDSMTLLQAAFSHNGFATNYFRTGKDGFFRKVVTERRITGPIVVTHTRNDNAVGKAYPIASRLNGESGAALGDANDKFGGIGRNGALFTPEAVNAQLLEGGGPAAYGFQPGKVYNLRSDQFIANHGDVTGPQVAHAILCAVSAT